MQSNSKQHCGVIITGAGIAGLVLSALLDRAGIDHLVLARQEPEGQSLQSETLPPSALPLLDRLGMHALFASCGSRSYGYHALWAGNELSSTHFWGQQPYPFGLKINKQTLLRALREQQEHRLLMIDGFITAAAGEGLCTLAVHAAGRHMTLAAPLVADATGRKRALLRKLGVEEERTDQQVAATCVLPLVRLPELRYDTFTESFAGGWGIVSALDGERQSMSLFAPAGSDTARAIRDYSHWPQVLRDTRLLRSFLSAAVQPQVRGAGAGSSRAMQCAGEGWLAIGDAAIAFDPLSSHGISNALYTVMRAVEVIKNRLRGGGGQAFARYDQNLQAIYGQYLMMREHYHAAAAAV